MTRFNYASSRLERTAGAAFASRRPRSRGSSIALCAALLFVAGVVTVQTLRLRVVEGDAATLAARRATLQDALGGLHGAEAEVRRLATVVAADRAVRRSGTLRANEVAAIGNALPADAWLTGLRIDAAHVAIEGRSARMHAVADALDALGRVRGVASVRLMSARRDATRSDVGYAIALERVP
jgi:Tfp pilus assembly protein PilN